jgi:integrase
MAMLNYCKVREEYRNYCLLGFGFYTALRIGDMLKMKWGDVYDFSLNAFKRHVSLIEQKTKKAKQFFINDNLRQILSLYKGSIENGGVRLRAGTYLFVSQKGENEPITRVQAYRVTRAAARAAGIDGVIGCHSMRKTFGYNASKSGTPPTVIMEIFNHSSFQVTKRYLGINQDEKDEVYRMFSYEKKDDRR